MCILYFKYFSVCAMYIKQVCIYILVLQWFSTGVPRGTPECRGCVGLSQRDETLRNYSLLLSLRLCEEGEKQELSSNSTTSPTTTPPQSPNTTNLPNTTSTHSLNKPNHQQHKPTTWICDICNQVITRKQCSIQCQHTPTHWIHKQCSHTTLIEYKQSQHAWKCQLHKIRTIPTITINNFEHNIHDQHTSQKHQNHPISNTQLNIIQININGIRNKISELTKLAIDYKADIITI